MRRIEYSGVRRHHIAQLIVNLPRRTNIYRNPPLDEQQDPGRNHSPILEVTLEVLRSGASNDLWTLYSVAAFRKDRTRIGCPAAEEAKLRAICIPKLLPITNNLKGGIRGNYLVP